METVTEIQDGLGQRKMVQYSKNGSVFNFYLGNVRPSQQEDKLLCKKRFK